MAGRFVILEFDSSEGAESLVTDGVTMEAWGCKAIALFYRPNKYCTCDQTKREQITNWVKGKRTGIYLCATCRKPSSYIASGLMGRLEYIFGYNQIKE